MDKQTKGILEGAAIGVIAGAIAGILLAPKSGKETRADIAKYLHEMKDKIAVKLAQVNDLTAKKYEQVVNGVVGGYVATKKITAEDAKEIKKKLGDNYKEIVAATKKAAKK